MELFRIGVNVDTKELRDFGPTVLVPCKVHEEPGEGDGYTAVQLNA